jgi:hypothetical protein
MMERIEKMRVSDDALDLVFRKARTYNACAHAVSADKRKAQSRVLADFMPELTSG